MSWSSIVVWFISGRAIERMETELEEMGGAINGMLVKENQNHTIQTFWEAPNNAISTFVFIWEYLGLVRGYEFEKKNYR
jgi:hypothetical protein